MSEEITTISRQTPEFTSMDFQALREEGIQYLQDLSGKLWTDHNAHDPGITMLEVLCYAITDLGYRTDFSIQDILTQDAGTPTDNFYTIRDIATSKPLTIEDYQRILFDNPNVKSGWLSLAKVVDQDTQQELNGLYDVYLDMHEHEVYGDLNDNSMVFTVNPSAIGLPSIVTIDIEFPSFESLPNGLNGVDTVSGSNLLNSATVASGGFIEVPNHEEFLLFADVTLDTSGGESYDLRVRVKTLDPIDDILNRAAYITFLQDELVGATGVALYAQFVEKYKAIREIIDQVKKDLSGNRNLCEDFRSFQPMNLQEIALDLDLEVTANINKEEVLAQVYHKVGLFLSPTVPFYSIREMLAKGKTMDEIFEGPALSSGFIDTEDLDLLNQQDQLYISDLVQIIMDVQGVEAVRKLEVSNFLFGSEIARTSRNCINLVNPRIYRARLNAERSDCVFSIEGQHTQTADYNKTLERLDELKALDRAGRKAGGLRDLSIPEGEDAESEDYYSVQHDMPLTYGVGENGLHPTESGARKAQAKQLKGFLLFFEQLLGAYLSQLANVRNLFAIDNSVTQTYFAQSMSEVPDVASLIKGLQEYADRSSLDLTDPVVFHQAFAAVHQPELDSLIESTDTFEDRRNRFLSHMMGRFSENFTDYALYLFAKDESTAEATLINDKYDFLNEYPVVSSERGWAHDYNLAFNTAGNVTGMKKRISRLLGLGYNNNMIADMSGFAVSSSTAPNIVLDPTSGNVLLTLTETFADDAEAWDRVDQIIRYGRTADNFEAWDDATDFRYELKDAAGNILIATPNAASYTAAALDRDAAIAYINSQFQFGFHVVENILLRPDNSGTPSLATSTCPGYDCLDVKDPYSFRIEVILPAWAEESTDPNFRRLFKRTMRLETPAHVFISFRWTTYRELEQFEAAYSNWLSEKVIEQNAESYTSGTLDGYRTTLINQINNSVRNFHDAEYTIAAPRYAGEYKDNDVIGRVSDPDGAIIKATLLSPAQMPDGMLLNAQTGEIYISLEIGVPTDQAGGYDLEIVTVNSFGEKTHHYINIFVKSQQPSVRVYDDVILVDDDRIGDFTAVAGDDQRLVYFTDPDGANVIVNVELAAGSAPLPPGTVIDNTPGRFDIRVDHDSGTMVVGTYNFDVVVTDGGDGSKTTLPVTLDIKPDNYTPNAEVHILPINETEVETTLITFSNAEDGGLTSPVLTDAGGNSLTLSTYGMELVSTGTPNQYVLRVGTTPTELSTFQSEVTSENTSIFTKVTSTDGDKGYYYLGLQFESEDGRGNVETINTQIQILESELATWSRATPRPLESYLTGAPLIYFDAGKATVIGAEALDSLNAKSLSELFMVFDDQDGYTLKVSDGASFQAMVQSGNGADGWQQNQVNYFLPFWVNIGDSDGRTSKLRTEMQILSSDRLPVDNSNVITQGSISDGQILVQIGDPLDDNNFIAEAEVDGFTTDNLQSYYGITFAAGGGIAIMKVHSATTFEASLTSDKYSFDGTTYTASFDIIGINKSGYEGVTTVTVSVAAAYSNNPISVTELAPKAYNLYTDSPADVLVSISDVPDGGIGSVEAVNSDGVPLDATALANMGLSLAINSSKIAELTVSDAATFIGRIPQDFTKNGDNYEYIISFATVDLVGNFESKVVTLRTVDVISDTPATEVVSEPIAEEAVVAGANPTIFITFSNSEDLGIDSITPVSPDEATLSTLGLIAETAPGGLARLRVTNADTFRNQLRVGSNYSSSGGVFTKTFAIDTTDGRGNVHNHTGMTISVNEAINNGQTFQTGYAYGFDDTDTEYIQTNTIYEEAIQSTKFFSVNFLIRPGWTSGTQDRPLMSNRGEISDQGFTLRFDLNNKLVFTMSANETGNSERFEVATKNAVVTNDWMMVGVTYDGSKFGDLESVAIYVEGRAVETELTSNSTGMSMPMPVDSPYQFFSMPNTSPRTTFYGFVAHMAVFNQTLSGQQMSALYNVGEYNGDPSKIDSVISFFRLDAEDQWNAAEGRYELVDSQNLSVVAYTVAMEQGDRTDSQLPPYSTQ